MEKKTLDNFIRGSTGSQNGFLGVMAENGKAMTLYVPYTADELEMVDELFVVTNDDNFMNFVRGREQERWLKGK